MQRRPLTLGLLPWLAAGPGAWAQSRPPRQQPSSQDLPPCYGNRQYPDGSGWQVSKAGMLVHSVIDSQRLGRHQRLVRLERRSLHAAVQQADGQRTEQLDPQERRDGFRLRLEIGQASEARIQHMLGAVKVALVPGPSDGPPPRLEDLDMLALQGEKDADYYSTHVEHFLSFHIPKTLFLPLLQGQASRLALLYSEGFEVFAVFDASSMRPFKDNPKHEKLVQDATAARVKVWSRSRQGKCLDRT